MTFLPKMTVIHPFIYATGTVLEPDVPHYLNSLATRLNDTIEAVNNLIARDEGVQTEFMSIREYINKQISTLDVPYHVANYIEEMVENGTLVNIISDDILAIVEGGDTDAIPELVERAVEQWFTDESGTDYLASLISTSIDSAVVSEINGMVNKAFSDEVKKYFTVPANSDNIVVAKNGVSMPSSMSHNYVVTYSADSANGKPVVIVEDKVKGTKTTYELTLTKV